MKLNVRSMAIGFLLLLSVGCSAASVLNSITGEPYRDEQGKVQFKESPVESWLNSDILTALAGVTGVGGVALAMARRVHTLTKVLRATYGSIETAIESGGLAAATDPKAIKTVLAGAQQATNESELIAKEFAKWKQAKAKDEAKIKILKAKAESKIKAIAS